MALCAVATAQPVPEAPPESPPAAEGSATVPPDAPQPTPEPAPLPRPAPTPAPQPPAAAPIVGNPVQVRKVELHGFVSQGAFVSTDNDYLGASSRGSLGL